MSSTTNGSWGHNFHHQTDTCCAIICEHIPILCNSVMKFFFAFHTFYYIHIRLGHFFYVFEIGIYSSEELNKNDLFMPMIAMVDRCRCMYNISAYMIRKGPTKVCWFKRTFWGPMIISIHLKGLEIWKKNPSQFSSVC